MFKGVLHEYEGEMLTIKTIAGRVSLAPSTIYKYLKQGYSLNDSIALGKKQSTKAFKNREKTNNRVAKKYPYKDKGELTIEEISELEKVSRESIYRRVKKGMTPEEAVIEIKRHIATKFPYLGGHYSRWTLERLTGVSKFYLDNNLDDNTVYTEEEVKAIIDKYKEPNVCTYQGMSLFSYCIKMRYNYNVIYYSMKTYKLTPEEAIKQYVQCGQLARFSHRYALGDILLYHFLIKMKIDDRYVNYQLRKGRSEEDALIDAIFLSKENYKNRSTRKRLRIIYGEITSLEDIESIRERYKLSEDDIAFMSDKVNRVEEVLTQYRLFSIIAYAQAMGNTDELQKMLTEMNITIEELSEIKEELLDGFVELDELMKDEKIKYIWRKEN